MNVVPGLLVICLGFTANALADSTCFGNTANGRLADGCKTAARGENFTAYATLGRWLGRTYVHCEVADVVEAAYRLLATSHPGKRFVYGETGFRNGGEFKPHKTHQNGLSVDFMVPVIDEKGRSVALPTGVTNKFGYSIEFDDSGRFRRLTIDFEALAAHLAALREAATQAGLGIWRVIFDPELQPMLRETDSWSQISNLKFSEKRSWVRHDEHYHVDFEIPCEPLEATSRVTPDKALQQALESAATLANAKGTPPKGVETWSLGCW